MTSAFTDGLQFVRIRNIEVEIRGRSRELSGDAPTGFDLRHFKCNN